MSDKAVTQPGGTTADFFQQYGEAATQRNIVGSLLKFTKFGDFVHGSYDDVLKHGTHLAAHMHTLAVGWQRWQNNRPADTRMGFLAEGFEPPKRSALGDMDQALWERDDDGKARDPWQFSNLLVLSDLKSRELYTFTTSSRGGLSAVGELAKMYSNHLRTHPDEVPIVELQMGSYQHPNKSYGKIRFPIFKGAGWMPANQLPPIDGSEPEAIAAPEDKPAPKQQRQKARDGKGAVDGAPF
jgi:hypothetical protein